MARRRYSDAERENALVALAANGGNITLTASQLAVPRKTLAAWANGIRHPEAGEGVPAKKKDMAEALGKVAWDLLGGITKEKIKSAPLTQIATSMGIAIDKARLLKGEPTAITQSGVKIDMSKLNDEQLEQLAGIVAAHERGSGVVPVSAEPVEIRESLPD